MTSIACSSNSLMLDGIFQGREKEIRITPDKKWISVFDVIEVVGNQKNARKTWFDIQKSNSEVVASCNNFKFPGPGQRDTPIINAQGLVLLLNQIPGETARQFRSASAKILVRYLGGDLTLIDEIKAIDQVHAEDPENCAQIFSTRPNGSTKFT